MKAKKENSQQSLLYTPADFFMLRAPAFAADLFFQLTASASEQETEDRCLTDRDLVASCYRQIQELLTHSEIEHALAVASLSLLEGINRVERGEISKRTERALSRALRYIIRMCNRPTPFGLFAGIAIGQFGEQTQVQMAVPALQHIRSRPDMHWLFEIIHQLEQLPEVVAQLYVTTNQTIHQVGGRVELPFAETYGQEKGETHAISLRATSTVHFVLEHASQPTRYADLRTKLLAAFPRATPEQANRLLWQLWENHFLVSDLRPPFTHKAPGRYVYERLRTLRGAETVAAEMQGILQQMESLDKARWQGPLDPLQDLVQRQRRLVADDERLQVQMQVDAALQLQSAMLYKEVGRVAAQVAEVLLRLSRYGHGLPHMRDYLAAFTERYEVNQEVPLLDLLSPELGLDAPAGYQHPPRTYPLKSEQVAVDTEYSRVLSMLAVQTINERKMEVEITADLLRQLERWSPQRDEAPPSLEIYLQLCAATQEDFVAGRWKAVVSPNCGSTGAGRSFGRFFDLFSGEQRAALQQLSKREEALYPDSIFAELSYLPRQARAANVAVRSGMRSYEIVAGVNPSLPLDHVIPLEDLVVGVRGERFYIRSLRLGKEVIVCQSHMLNPASAPNACRFLLECGTNLFACLSAFDWEIAATFPFLPRVVYQQIVLRPAQWRLTSAMLVPTGSGDDDARWFAGLQQWRTTWRVPRYVYLAEVDNRLLLDLEHPLLALELRTELAKLAQSGALTIEEVLPGFDQLWLEDERGAKYFSEVVVPLVRDKGNAEEAQSSPARFVPERVLVPAERCSYPGEAWVYLNLYAAAKQHDEIIAGPLREIVRELLQQTLIDTWFYIRYYDSAPHLRVRFHAASEQKSQDVLMKTLRWCRQLVERGLLRTFSMLPYEREVERYGGPETIAMMEKVFMADSVSASNVVVAVYQKQVTLDPIASTVFTLDRFFADWGLSFPERLQWAQRCLPKEARKEFHEQRQLLCDLLAPWVHTTNMALLEQRAMLSTLIEPQQAVVRAAGGQIREVAAQRELWVPEENILQTLAHMHVNRYLDINVQRERKIYAFWRQALESIQLRPGNGKENFL